MYVGNKQKKQRGRGENGKGEEESVLRDKHPSNSIISVTCSRTLFSVRSLSPTTDAFCCVEEFLDYPQTEE